jgi:hypothetical protein
MTNPLAVTTVTAAFAQLLSRALTDSGHSGAAVRLEPPDPALDLAKPILNLFLYDVRPHPSFQGSDAPFRDQRGDLVRRPVLPLSLHYLLTSYGHGAKGTAGNQLEAQHMLAHAMTYVHDNAMLTRAHIREAVTAYSGGANPIYAALAASDLDAQIELVKLTPQPQTPEDVSRMWTALNQTYRLSVSYEASVVLIERRRPAKTAPPVRSTGIYVLPLDRPVIESLAPLSLSVDDSLLIGGRNLASPEARVRFASGDADRAKTKISDREIRVEELPAGLRAGANAVVVVHDVRMGLPPAPGQPPPLHRGFESNAGLFTLRPAIRTDLTDGQGNPIAIARASDFTIEVAPAVGRTQQATLLLGGRAIEPPQVPAPPAAAPDPTETLTFQIPADQPTGLQLIQVRVDGAESALELETDEADPLFNQYVGPKVRVT